MSREGSSSVSSSNPNPTASASSSADGSEEAITEDTNNNTSLVSREQLGESTAAESHNGSNSPAIREIHKNSWLKRMPCTERWPGRFPKAQKPEKFWVVFCVHDDKDAFLEFYENRRSAYSHLPINNISLAKCLHISPTIVAQENDHEFVTTLESQVIRLAASTNEQMLEWMDTMKTKLRELGILEPKDNLYSKEPITSARLSGSVADFSSDHIFRDDLSRLSVRDPNSPLPPVPSSLQPEPSTSSSAVVYVRNPSILRSSVSCSNRSTPSPPTTSSEPLSNPESVFSFEPTPSDSDQRERLSRSSSLASQESTSPATTPTAAEPISVPSSLPNEQTLYEPLFCAPAPPVSMGIRNPNYENPPPPQQRLAANPVPALPPRQVTDQRRMSSSVASDMHSNNTRSSGLSNLAATSDPSLHASLMVSNSEPVSPQRVLPASGAILLRSQSHQDDRNASLPAEEGPPPYNVSARHLQGSSNGSLPVDETGKPLSLREVQVQKLQSEILHKSGVRLVLRKKDCINAIALVESFNYVWVAGWKQKEHPLLHNTFHVGDRIISIGGHRILSVQDAHKAIKHQSSIVEFVVRRVPCGRVLALKREYEGQDLGIVREGGTAEVHDRLNAVGLDLSILVQPVDLVKAFKKQLKTLRSYKDYIVQ